MADAKSNQAATPDLNVDVTKTIGTGALANVSAGDANENLAKGADPQAGGFVNDADAKRLSRSDPLGNGE